MSTPDPGDLEAPTSEAGPQPTGPSITALYLRLLSAAIVVVGFDQLTKEIALNALSGRSPLEVIPGILQLRLTYNSGGAFGILQGAPALFLLATIVIVVAILLGLRNVEDHRWAIPLGMVLGGGVGNAIDRLMRDTDGGVVDFIDLHVWPVFNVADSAIVVGAALILLMGLRGSDEA